MIIIQEIHILLLLYNRYTFIQTDRQKEWKNKKKNKKKLGTTPLMVE